ncbi:soluble pyridine nucleotide transhydrogenase [mine drainage metagenome]|uniref:NAD(P)(+) transhydrogenase (Si-specific) n=1 Tax=mine drainage metagenome TaxID=410659 RepID=A0A1J5SL73_9ZZZZ
MVQPMAAQHFDLIVLGSGPAGEKGAAYAAGLGKRVALVERETILGGTVANSGTLPSKTMREAAVYLAGYRQRGIHGVTVTLQDHLTTQDLLYRERLVRQLEQARIRSHLDQSRVSVFHGSAAFVDSHTVRVRSGVPGSSVEEFLVGTTFLVATGASPVRPDPWPASHPTLFDSDSILQMRDIPERMVVVGGGVIGCEYACIFASFGVKVTLVCEDERLLPFLDFDVSMALVANMRSMGIDVRLADHVVAVRQGVTLAMVLRSGTALAGAVVLLALGRQGNTASLDLGAAGLSADERGLLTVNENFQTAQSNIYAAGDVIGFPALASAAREQALRAMVHAFNPDKAREESLIQPYGIYTIPECSMAGETEDKLSAAGVPWVSGIAHFSANARGQIIGARSGFVKLLYHRETLKLLGVHVIGEGASELVHTGLVALHMGATAQTFLDLCFNYPTLGELYKTATQDALSKRAPAAPPGSAILRRRE